MPTFTLISADEGSRSTFLSPKDKDGLTKDLQNKYPNLGITGVTFQEENMVVTHTGTIPTEISKSNAVNPIILNTSDDMESRTFSYQFKTFGGRKTRGRRNMRKKRTMKRKGNRK